MMAGPHYPPVKEGRAGVTPWGLYPRGGLCPRPRQQVLPARMPSRISLPTPCAGLPWRGPAQGKLYPNGLAPGRRGAPALAARPPLPADVLSASAARELVDPAARPPCETFGEVVSYRSRLT